MKQILYAIFFMASGLMAQTLPGDFLNADYRIPDIPQSPEVNQLE
ncbi:MAG: hypothetical protein AAFP76_11120 [Bacteroidota bacterium]